MMESMMRRALPPAIRRQPWAAAASTTKQNDSSGGLFTALWMSMQTRGLRDYPVKPLVRNHKFLRKGYDVDKEWSLGIELKPSEVKSLRDRNADLSSAFGEFYKGELFLHHMTIPVWRSGLIGRPEPTRVRKLLANKSELKRMHTFLQQPNALLLPVRVEVGNTGWIKVIMAQCFKAAKVDNRKRDDERDAKRQLRDW